MKHKLKLLALATAAVACLSHSTLAQDVLFDCKPDSSTPLSASWPSTYSHLPGVMTIGVAPAANGPVPEVLVFELKEPAPPDAAGKAAYLRSKGMHANYKKLTFEWRENFPTGISGPAFEIWNGVTGKPNELGKRILGIDQGPDGFVVNKAVLAARAEGWHRVRVVLDTTASTFDLYSDDMAAPIAAKVPLSVKNDTWDMLGLGFCLYVRPGQSPEKWQIADVTVTGQ